MSAVHARVSALWFFSSVWVWSISLWQSWTCRARSHFLMVFYPSLGSCKFILEVSILRDAYYHLETFRESKMIFESGWLISPLTTLVSFPQEIQAAKDKESPLLILTVCRGTLEEAEFLQVFRSCSQSSWPEPFNSAHDHLASWLLSSS